MYVSPSLVLASKASGYCGGTLHVRCYSCQSHGIIVIADLPDFLHRLAMADLIKRLVCLRCGSSEPSSVELRHCATHVFLIGADRDL
jgi:hypothetical protein